MSSTTSKQVLQLYLKHLKNHGWLWLLMIGFIIVSNIFETLLPVGSKWVIDALTVAKPNDQSTTSIVIQAIIGYSLLRLGIEVSWRLVGIVLPYVYLRTNNEILTSAYEKVFKQSYQFFTDEFAGALIRRVQRLGENFNQIAEATLWSIIPAIMVLLSTFVLFFKSYPWFGAFFLIWTIVFFVMTYLVIKWKSKLDIIRAEKESAHTAALSDGITNAINVMLFNGQEYEHKRFKTITQETYKASYASWRIVENNWIGISVLVMVLEVGFLAIAYHQWKLGQLTVGDFALVQGLASVVVYRLWNTGQSMRNVMEAIATAKESLDTLNRVPSVLDDPKAKALKLKKGELAFEHVRFGYKEGRDILKDIDVTIKAGEKVAFVGPSGAGKSTLIKLILRAYDATAGSINIDGQAIAKVTQESLRDAISFVPQEPVLFHRSLLENIRYGRRNASEKDVIEAAKKAHCHEFISKLEKGYDTEVGERGIKLSGGERQRVAIARAILKNAPILILDEATSSLDSESEALIQDALKELMKKKTVLVIAHRLSTVMQMDRLLVMEDGHIIDQGTHDQLVKKVGLYQKLWNIQAGGFNE